MDSLQDFFFAVLISRLLAIRPRIFKSTHLLVATSDWRSQLLSFGFGSRKVTVDPAQKLIRIMDRRYWLAHFSKRIEFDWVQEIIYGYREAGGGFYTYQQTDLFNVGLLLKDGKEIVLFRFFGEGDFVNNSVFPDWMYWDDFLLAECTRGPQQPQSMLFADLLSRMIGVPIGNPAP